MKSQQFNFPYFRTVKSSEKISKPSKITLAKYLNAYHLRREKVH